MANGSSDTPEDAEVIAHEQEYEYLARGYARNRADTAVSTTASVGADWKRLGDLLPQRLPAGYADFDFFRIGSELD